MSTHNSGLGIELKIKRNTAFAFEHESKWSQKKMWNWRKSVEDWGAPSHHPKGHSTTKLEHWENLEQSS